MMPFPVFLKACHASLLCLCVSLLMSFVPGLRAQSASAAESAFDSAYAARVTQSEINGVYIPQDLEDAIAELRRLSSPQDLEKFRSAPEDVARNKLHFGLGKWIILNWGFYEGSRLSHWLSQAGLEHPDDMARSVIVCFHRSLNGLDTRLQDEVNYYKALREQERLEREKNQKVISEEKRIREDRK